MIPRAPRSALRLVPLLLGLTLLACGDDEEPGTMAAGAHAGLGCTDCHAAAPRGDVVAAVADSLCATCHAAAGLSPQVAVANVTMPHAAHPGLAGSATLTCGACHAHADGERELTVATASCFLCHAELPEPGIQTVATLPAEGCFACHVQPTHTAFASSGAPIDHATVLERGLSCLLCHYDVIEGTGAVPEPTCRGCHGLPGGPAPVPSDTTMPVDALHAVHVQDTTDFTCVRCHEPVDHSVVALASSLVLECESCHAAGSDALRPPIDSAVHRNEQLLYAGLDPHHPEVDPSVKFLERVACTSCHSAASMASAPAGVARIQAIDVECVSCHGPRFGNLLPLWLRGMRDNVATVGAFTRAAAAAGPVRASARGDSLVRAAAAALQFLDSAGGVHNIPGADAALRGAVDDALAAFRAAGLTPPGRPRLGPSVAAQPCLRCHYGIEAQQQQVFAQSFDHGEHVIDAGVACGDCHSSAELFEEDGRTFDATHGRTPLTAAGCMACHHTDRANECARCHTGDEVGALRHVADITVHIPRDDIARTHRAQFRHAAHASLGCVECHSPADPALTPTTCGECHTPHHQDVASPAGCAECHTTAPLPNHRRTDHLECGACHTTSTLQLFGTADRAFCLQCHRDQAAHRPGGECAECHLQLSPQEAMSRILSAREASR